MLSQIISKILDPQDLETHLPGQPGAHWPCSCPTWPRGETWAACSSCLQTPTWSPRKMDGRAEIVQMSAWAEKDLCQACFNEYQDQVFCCLDCSDHMICSSGEINLILFVTDWQFCGRYWQSPRQENPALRCGRDGHYSQLRFWAETIQIVYKCIYYCSFFCMIQKGRHHQKLKEYKLCTSVLLL